MRISELPETRLRREKGLTLPWKQEAKARGCYIRGCFNETSFPIRSRRSLLKRRQTRVWILLARVKRLSVRFICNQRDRASTKAKYSNAKYIWHFGELIVICLFGMYKNISMLILR